MARPDDKPCPAKKSRRPRSGPRLDSLPPHLEPTTLWDFPSQNYGGSRQGDKAYPGATPSQVVWNLLQRYTRPGDLVVDPMAGSGTTLDVARELGRRALGYDIAPPRPDVFRADARKLPLEDGKAAFVFVDPPYSTHIRYSDSPDCIGRLDAAGAEYYAALELAIGELHRILAPGRHMAMLVSDSFVKDKGFFPIGFELFSRLRKRFEPVDMVVVARRNRTLEMGNYRLAAERGNFFLRGFTHLFIMLKPSSRSRSRGAEKPSPASSPARFPSI